MVIVPIIFLCFLGLDFYAGGTLLHVVGWVYLLPNHDYLYVFSILPLVAAAIGRRYKNQNRNSVNSSFASILVFGGALYILAGGAQVWRLPIIPIGLLTVTMGFALIREGVALTNGDLFKTNINRAVFGLTSFGFIFISTIYLQPWSLVFDLPKIQGKNYEYIDLSGTHFNLTKFINVDLKGATFTGASLQGVEFINVNLDGVSFRDADIENTLFDSSSLVGADFTNADIYQTEFTSSDLQESILMPSFVGRTYIKDSMLCKAVIGDLRQGVYGWQGSTIDETSRTLIKGSRDGHRKYDELKSCES